MHNPILNPVEHGFFTRFTVNVLFSPFSAVYALFLPFYFSISSSEIGDDTQLFSSYKICCATEYPRNLETVNT